jgi:hypothetical protein
MLKNIKSRLTVIVLAALAPPVFAAGPDMTSLTTAVDFGTVSTAILAVCAALVVVYVVFKGAKLVIGAVRSA